MQEGLFTFTREDVEKLIRSLPGGKAPGPDGLTAEFFKLAPFWHSKYLFLLYVKVLEKGHYPEGWRKAIVIPIYKGGERKKPSNYRPISLTSLASKIFEKLLVRYIVSEFDRVGALGTHQYGFRQGYSCDTQLAGLVQDLADAVDSGESIHALFLDFEKAFDKAPHDKMVTKLAAFVRDWRVVRCVNAFLRGRKMAVKVGSSVSEEGDITSGVPQGSVLGPIVFCGLLSDMHKEVDSAIRLFADDSTVYRKVNKDEDSRSLQADIDKIFNWVESNEMKLNIDKCAVVKFGKKSRDIHQYKLGDKEVTQQQNYKYLGVILNEKLSWEQNVDYVVKKAGRNLEFVMRTLKGTDRRIKTRAYETLVRPTLEYGMKAGDPYRQGQKADLEMIQRRAARRVLNKYHRYEPEGVYDSATDMVKGLGWTSLEERRELDRLCGMYKIVNHHKGWEEMSGRILRNERLGRGDHTKKLCVDQVRTDVGKYSFLNRTVKDWNSLDENVVLAKGSKQFRKGAEKWLNDKRE